MTRVTIPGCAVIVAVIGSISAAPPQTGFITHVFMHNLYRGRAGIDFHPTSDNSWIIVYYKTSIYTDPFSCYDYDKPGITPDKGSATLLNSDRISENEAQGYCNIIHTYNTSILADSYLVQSCCFVDVSGDIAYGNLEHIVWNSITTRPDNGVVNSSPVTNMVTFLNVQRGCQVSITIPVWEPDGDVVECTINITSPHFLLTPSQSSSVVSINEKTCRLTLLADEIDSVSSGVEYYMVPVRISDFAWNDFSTPMANVPLYFTATFYKSNASCDDKPRFIAPTPADGSKILVRDNENITVNITVSSTNELYNIAWTVDKELSSGVTTNYTTEEEVISWRTFTWISSSSDRPVYIMCLSATDKITGQDATVRCIYFVRFVQEEKLFPYGLSQGDEVLKKTDDSCSNVITVEEGVPIFGKLHRDIYVCANGIISFDQAVTNPSSLQGTTVLAPYFSDIDLKNSGRVFYSSFNLLRSQNDDLAVIIESMKSNISMFDRVEDYTPTFVLIATWHMAQPFRTTITNEEATFQLVLITDGELTYVMYLYGKMKWHSVVGLPPIWIGYSVRGTYQETNVNSFTKLALNITENVETLGVKGMLLYKLTNTNLVRPNYEVRCLKWYNANSNQLPAITANVDSLPQCPCDMVSLFLNSWVGFPQPSLFNEDTVCSDVWPAGRFIPHGKSCCYNTVSGLWTDEIPFAGSYYSYHPQTFPREHTINDKTAKSNCCVMSNLCHLFYKLRPIGTCEKTQQNRIGTTWGDPHFKTLDNKTFTFNGLGEFVLLKADTFTLQARTERAVKADGNLFDATIFTAFAAEDSVNASVQVELKLDRSGIHIYGNKVDLTRKFYQDHEVQGRFNFTSKEGNLVITSEETNTTSIFFPSDGIALNISVGANMLSLTKLIPSKFINKTSGLVGNYDGDADNDFQTPGGEIRDSNLTERDIFEYGMLWSVTENTSVFVYPHGKTHADFNVPEFQPRFLDDAPEDKLAVAKAECGSDDNLECIFDLVFKESLEVALNTKMAKAHYEEVSSELKKRTPHLVGCDTINVSVGDTVICPVTVDEQGELSFHLSSNNSGAYFNETDLTIVFVQTSTDPVDIRLTVENKDEKKSPEIRIGIILCSGCSNHGTCLLNVTRKDDRNTEFFKYAKCECWPEYQGLDCEEDFDGCASKPCSHGRQCVDLPADKHRDQNKSFTCGQCPTGFLADGDKCVDMNECELHIDNCDHICTNTDGSFTCSCNSGYRKDQSNAGQCNDINECDEAMSNCEQMCVNTDGGFNCTCFKGYALLNGACVTVNDVCTNATEVNCSSTAGCTLDEGGNPVCFCNQGYELVNNGTSCEDIDECLQNVCPQTCKNFIGGFECSCYAGFQLNDINECEVCEFPYWGFNCNHTCKCSSQGTESCSPLKGCVCKAGWRGISCREDIDECMDSPGICDDVRKVCSNTNGSYTCHCTNGFQSNSYGICKDINECSDPTLHDCAQQCSNTEGGYSCSCEEGYTEYNSTQCLDIDECATGQSGCEQSCENFQGFYNCYCYFGFVLNDDRRTCMKVSDPCETYSNLTCAHLCFVEDDMAECRCNLGYELNADGETCTDVNECTLSNNLCNDIASCTNTDGSYLCVCPSGYKLQNDGRTCLACDKFHYGVNCQEECSCLHGHCNNIRGCVCNDGWSGSKCDVDIDECLTSQHTCTLPNSVCTNTPGNFSCRCKTGFELTGGKCQDIDECADVRAHNCSQICSNTIGSYVCSCEAGFLFKQGRCSDINECSGVHGCEQYCENSIGSYRCTCKPGFKLSLSDRQSCIVESPCSDEMTEMCHETNADCFMENEEQKCQCRKGFESFESGCVDIKECSMEPCDQECVELEGGYSCECTVGFQLDTDMMTCTVCTMGFYGIKCEQICNCNASNTVSCDPVYGTCVCEYGWQGITCEDDIDECSNDTACDDSAQCSNSIGSYQCRCPRGFVPTSESICKVCDDWTFGDNCEEDCVCEISNSASCNNIDGSCICIQGWEGAACDVDVDECAVGSCLLLVNGYCSNTPGSFECNCLNGFMSHNASCIDDDECADGEKCFQNCTNSPGTYQCVCYHGFRGNGYDCEECPLTTYGFNCSEECNCTLNHTIPNDAGRLCEADNGTCFCNNKWTGVMCDEDVNECADSQICTEVANAGCHNTQGGFSCDCFKGYSKGRDGVCMKDAVDTTVNRTALEGLSVLHFVVSFDISLQDGVDLNVSTTFIQYALAIKTSCSLSTMALSTTTPSLQRRLPLSSEQQLMQFYRERLGGGSMTLVIIVTGLRRGSLVGEYALGFEDTEDVRSQIFSSQLSLSRGIVLTLSDQNVTTHDMTEDTTCGLFTLIVGNCGEDQDCVEENSSAVCRDKKTGDFLILIMVVSSLGGVSLLVVSIGICVRYLRKKNTNDGGRNADNAGVVEEAGFKPPGMRERGMTWRRIFLAERGPGKGPLHIPRVTIDAKSSSEDMQEINKNT